MKKYVLLLIALALGSCSGVNPKRSVASLSDGVNIKLTQLSISEAKLETNDRDGVIIPANVSNLLGESIKRVVSDRWDAGEEIFECSWPIKPENFVRRISNKSKPLLLTSINASTITEKVLTKVPGRIYGTNEVYVDEEKPFIKITTNLKSAPIIICNMHAYQYGLNVITFENLAQLFSANGFKLEYPAQKYEEIQ